MPRGQSTPLATLEVGLANTAARADQAAVLWFLTNGVGKLAHSVRLLRHADKQAFAVGKIRDLPFDLNPVRDLSCLHD